MSLFSRIRDSGDVLGRAAQLQEQVDKLEGEKDFGSRPSFIRRCNELKKHIEKHVEIVQKVKINEHKYNKTNAIEGLRRSQRRLERFLRGSFTREDTETNEENKEEVEGEEREEGEVKSSRTEDSYSPQPALQGIVAQVGPRREANNQSGRLEEKVPQSTSMYGEEKEEDSDEELPEERQPRLTQSPENISFSKREAKSVASRNRPKESEEEEKNEKNQPSASRDIPGRSMKAPGRIVEGDMFQALADLNAEEKEDLTIQKGDLLKILETRPDGWWTAENEKGQRGLVPRTFLGHIPVPASDKVHEKERVRIPPAPRSNLLDVSTFVDRRRTLSEEQQKQMECLGDALALDKHVSLACHLTPRLSESNLAFHDLFWNHEHNMLRKRHVRVCKLVRVVRVEKTNGLGEGGGFLRACLFDRTRKTGRQIVSNVHTIRAKIGRSEWTFAEKRESGDGLGFGEFLLRSNYRQAKVNLLLQVSTFEKNADGSRKEKSVGIVEIPLIDDSGKCLLINKSYAEILVEARVFDDFAGFALERVSSIRKLILKIRDPPQNILHQVDSLPDVILLNALHISVTFYFRRHAGRVLLREDSQRAGSAELVNDLVLALFPSTADDYDVLDMLSIIWASNEKALKHATEEEATSHFRDLFSSLCLCLLARPFIQKFTWNPDPKLHMDRDSELRSIAEALSSKEGTAKLLSRVQSAPLKPTMFCFDLLSEHAID